MSYPERETHPSDTIARVQVAEEQQQARLPHHSPHLWRAPLAEGQCLLPQTGPVPACSQGPSSELVTRQQVSTYLLEA